MVEGDNKILLSGINFAALIADGFDAAELFEPMRAIEEAGGIVRIVSVQAGKIRGVDKDESPHEVEVDMTFDEADALEFAAVFVPGGAESAEKMQSNPHARAFIQGVDDNHKPIAAIGHGIGLLIEAGLVKGRTLTSPPALKERIERAGGRWADQETVTDANVVSGRHSQHIPAFIQAMLDATQDHILSHIGGTRDENSIIGPSS